MNIEEGLIFYLHTVTVTCCQSKLKSILNFLHFFQFLFDLLGDLIFAQLRTERRIRSTICDSLFWVIRELKHEDFSRRRRRQLTVETGTRSIAHDIPQTNDVALPPTTWVWTIWRRTGRESDFWDFIAFVGFFYFCFWFIRFHRFQSMHKYIFSWV